MQVFASFGLHSGPRSRSATPLMNTSDMEAKVSIHPDSRHATAFNLKPLMVAYMACTMAMMAFVALIGPIARLLHLPAWQAGAVVTVGGVLWMLLSRPWGTLSDRRGRRAVCHGQVCLRHVLRCSAPAFGGSDSS